LVFAVLKQRKKQNTYYALQDDEQRGIEGKEHVAIYMVNFIKSFLEHSR